MNACVRFQVILVGTILTMVSGCGGGQTPQPTKPAPRLDLGSPEKAVRSFWDYERWRTDEARSRRKTELMQSPVLSNVGKASEVKALDAAKDPLDSQKVERVEQETPTRAIVHVIVPGERPGHWKYVTVLETEKWSVEEVLIRCEVCGGTGKEEDIDAVVRQIQRGVYDKDNPPMQTCPICEGRGWDTRLSE